MAFKFYKLVKAALDGFLTLLSILDIIIYDELNIKISSNHQIKSLVNSNPCTVFKVKKVIDLLYPHDHNPVHYYYIYT